MSIPWSSSKRGFTELLCRTFRRGRWVALGVALMPAGLGAAEAQQMQPAPAAQVDVQTRIVIQDIPSVNEKDHTFQLTGLLELQWQDPRVAPGVYVEQQAEAALANIWHPDLEFDNERDPRKSENQVLTIREGGNVTWQERFDSQLSTSFDLRRLPFDEQHLNLILQTFSLDKGTIHLKAGAGSEISPEVVLPEWNVAGLTAQEHLAERNEANRYSELLYTITIERRPGFYFYSIVIPSLLVVLVAFASLWYDRKQYNAIVGPGVSCMLVLIALSFTMSSYLPRVSYVTALSRFSLQCYVFVFLCIMANTVVHVAMHEGQDAQSNRLRKFFQILLPAGFVVSNAVIVVEALR